MSNFCAVIAMICVISFPVVLLILIIRAILKRTLRVPGIMLAIIGGVFAISVIVGVATSCKHEDAVVDEKQPTCTEAGYVLSKCKLCDREKEEEIQATGHQLKEIEFVAAQCEVDGKIISECLVCGAEEETVLEKMGHFMEEIARIEPTEQAEGNVSQKCLHCGYTEETILPKLEQKETVIEKEQEDSVKETMEEQVQPEENPAEILQQQMESAERLFGEGNYKEAIAACGKILAEHSEQDVVQNVTQFLEEQYAKYLQFTAADLWAEYDGNIVKADRDYNNQIVVITGEVSKIDKTNFDRNLAVLLKNDEMWSISSVQLNFDLEQTDSVALLKEGQTIRAIGKCTGQSSISLLSAGNVMIEECVIIG